MTRIGIIGATGWLGSALGLGLLRHGSAASDLVLLNRSGARGAYEGHPGVVWARDLPDLLARSGPIVLSTRPEDFPQPGFSPGARLIISFMAAHTMDSLRARAPEARLVRMMPNGGASTGTSWTPWVAGDLSPGDEAVVQQVIAAMGQGARVESEDQLDILSAISGSGAAYPALMARAMVEKALALGLPQEIAEAAVESVICGSGPLLAGKMGALEPLIDSYLSYRGITAAGMEAAGGIASAVDAAFEAAVAKARAMGR